MKKEMQFYPDERRRLAYDRDQMSTVVDGGDAEDQEPKDAFEYANELEYVVIRNFNGNGQLTSVGKEDMEKTTEQFSWEKAAVPGEREMRTCGRKMPVPRRPRRKCI